jgi:hypothetical protein
MAYQPEAFEMTTSKNVAFRQAVAVVSIENQSSSEELIAVVKESIEQKLTTEELVAMLRSTP